MRLPRGFLGTRADVLMDVILVGMLATPCVLVWAIGLVLTSDNKWVVLTLP